MSALPWLNYHHLQYFQTIVQEGGVTRAAAKLRLSQSTLSAQLRALEESLGAALFRRDGRRLELTEAGRVALNYAEDIFRTGDELKAWFAGQHSAEAQVIRIGALSPLSKNLQFEMIRPYVMEGKTKVHVVEGELPDLMERLRKHQIDVVLSNLPLGGVDAEGTHAHLLGEMPVYLVGRPPFKIPKKKFPHWLKGIPLFLPSSRTSARIDFDALLIRKGITPMIHAEVDDMALLRLLALSGAGLALVPEIGVKFELEDSRLLRIEKVPGLVERFYAITAHRKTPPATLPGLLENGRRALEAVRKVSRGRAGTK